MAINITSQNPTAAVEVDASVASAQVQLSQDSPRGGVDVSVMGGNGSVNMWQPGVNISITSSAPLTGLHRWMRGYRQYLIPGILLSPTTTIECLSAREGTDTVEGLILRTNGENNDDCIIDYTSNLLLWINERNVIRCSLAARPDQLFLVKIGGDGTLYVNGEFKGQFASRTSSATIRLFDSRAVPNTLFWLKLWEGETLMHYLQAATDFEGTPCIWDKVTRTLIYPPEGVLAVGDDL